MVPEPVVDGSTAVWILLHMRADAQGLVTLGDIARHVGVSKATVSRALNAHPRIGAATRRRVLAAAQELGYRPDPRLASLVSRRWPGGRGSESAVLVNLVDRFTGRRSDKLAGAEAAAAELGYRMRVLQIETIDDLAEQQRLFLEGGVRGLLVDLHDPLVLPGLDWTQFCVVLVGEEHPELAFNRVGTDWRGVVRLGVERARAAGARRIGFVLRHLVGAGLHHHLLSEMLAAAWQLDCDALDRVLVLGADDDERACFGRWLEATAVDTVLTPDMHPWQWLAASRRRIGYVQLIATEEGRQADLARVDLRLGHRMRVAVGLLHDLLRLDVRGMPDDSRTVLCGPSFVGGASLGAC